MPLWNHWIPMSLRLELLLNPHQKSPQSLAGHVRPRLSQQQMQHRRKPPLLPIRQQSNLRPSLGAREQKPLMWLSLPMNNRVQMSKQPMSQLHRPGRHEHAVRQSQSSKKLHRQVLLSQW
jgi:hypothetical protein